MLGQMRKVDLEGRGGILARVAKIRDVWKKNIVFFWFASGDEIRQHFNLAKKNIQIS